MDGLRFRNHPLAWWAHLVRHQRHAASPVIFLQAKCDAADDDVLPFPIPQEILDALPYKRQQHVSAKVPRGGNSLLEALQDAIAWMRRPDRLGVPRVGSGRVRLQRRLEALRDAEAALPVAERRHRWMERAAFDVVCAEVGGITSPEHALAWLDASGVVFHRPGLFGDRIILDQAWALDAIYAVFDRDDCYRQILAQGGRFSRWLLGLTKWREHGDAEQRLLLGMMRSCGICFLHQRAGGSQEDDQHDEYIVPELLPGREAMAARLAAAWDEDAPSETLVLRYPLLHEGLIRTIMAEVGELSGANAVYWKGGFCGFEAETRSRLMIEQQMDDCGMRGVLRIRAQHG